VENINGAVRQCARFVPFEDAALGELVADADILVNATGIGMYPTREQSPLNKELLRPEHLVIDITYNPARTRLLLDAEARGCRVMNGLGMAIHQAVRGFSLMTGKPEPSEIMRRVTERIVAGRSEGGA
jgi:shikimate dehydrogenase